jgi:hypothetical protein
MRSRVAARAGSAVCMLAALGLIVMVGCERGEDGERSAGQKRAERKADTAEPKDDPLADMVSAVTSAKQSAPVELKFLIKRRPEVGKPIDVQIAVLPVSVLTRIAANFQAGPGLELRSGGAMPAIEKPAAGVPLAHRLIVIPQRDGIFFISAVVQADSVEQSLTRTFSIPIIAGQGQAPTPVSSEERPADPKRR